jgi:hypothetical protein
VKRRKAAGERDCDPPADWRVEARCESSSPGGALPSASDSEVEEHRRGGLSDRPREELIDVTVANGTMLAQFNCAIREARS